MVIVRAGVEWWGSGDPCGRPGGSRRFWLMEKSVGERGMITPFGWQNSLGLLVRQGNYDTPSSGLVASERSGCDAAVIFPDGHVIEM